MIFYYWKKNVNSIISNRREGFVMQIETYSGKASMTEGKNCRRDVGIEKNYGKYILIG